MIYPWWQTGFHFFDETNLAPGVRSFFRKKQRSVNAYYAGNDQRFVNTQPWPVFVDEIRFFQYHSLFNPNGSAYYNAFDAFATKITTSRDGSIINQFLPVSSLFYSDSMRADPRVERRGGKFTLPQPMHLGSTENFSFRVFPGAGGVASIDGIQIGLLGFDEKNEAPVVRTAAPITITAGQSPTDYVLDAGRDKNIRELTLEEISFSISGGVDDIQTFWEVELEIEPPRGPRWTEDVATHLGFIVDQLPQWYYNRGALVMQPVTPLQIDPGGNVTVELLTTLFATTVAERAQPGWIACMLFGHQEVPDDYDR
jgi:hypothetical protein